MSPEAKPPPRPGPLRPVATVAEVQADIDAGLTGEKTAVLDPAAAPLGTDEEAGGASASPHRLAEERRQARSFVSAPDSSDAAIDAAERRRFSPTLALLLAAMALGAVAAVAVFG